MGLFKLFIAIFLVVGVIFAQEMVIKKDEILDKKSIVNSFENSKIRAENSTQTVETVGLNQTILETTSSKSEDDDATVPEKIRTYIEKSVVEVKEAVKKIGVFIAKLFSSNSDESATKTLIKTNASEAIKNK